MEEFSHKGVFEKDVYLVIHWSVDLTDPFLCPLSFLLVTR